MCRGGCVGGEVRCGSDRKVWGHGHMAGEVTGYAVGVVSDHYLLYRSVPLAHIPETCAISLQSKRSGLLQRSG